MIVNYEHKPVMAKEVLEYLDLDRRSLIVDATVGTGAHSLKILEALPEKARLIGLDRDEESLEIARERLKKFENRFTLVHSDFRYIDKALADLKIKSIDGILFDLGISSYQLQEKSRGFSFREDAPLDMRMDKASYISAYDLVNNLTEKEISDILRSFGEERWHNRIARYVVRERMHSPIATTGQLRDLVSRAVGYRYSRQRIHPATRTFQALRIAVNRELEALSEALSKTSKFLKKGSRICVISFHSLEDRIVKHNFRELAAEGKYKLLTKKPLLPTEDEVEGNSRSRSAKMRVAQRI